MAPRVLISDALSPAAVQIFKDRGVEVDFQPNLGKDKDKLAEVVGNFDGLAIRSATKVSPKILEKAKNLKVIGRAGIGVDNVDIPAATAKGVIVMNTPFGNSITTAEHAISLMLALARQIPEADVSTRAGKWEKNKFMGVEIFGKTLGVIGCGNIGSIVADRGVGLKMKVIAYDPFLSPERAVDLGVEKVELDELLRRADPVGWPYSAGAGWPVGVGRGAKGNVGVRQSVFRYPGSLGWVSDRGSAHVDRVDLRIDGRAVPPSAAASLRSLAVTRSGGLVTARPRVGHPPAGSYPFVVVGHQATCAAPEAPGTATVARAWLGYVLTSAGQRAVVRETGSVALPSRVRTPARAAVGTIREPVTPTR